MCRTAIVVVACVVVAACASQGFPGGGPRDETPPAVQRMVPPDGTVQFREQSFSIEFDEYITLKDADNNIIVSPPMNPKPQYTAKGRTLVVKLRDSLQPHTTYHFLFHDAVVDYTEGNALAALSYAFATGDALDSLQMQGVVVQALTGEPVADAITVALYDSLLADTALLTATPAYVTRSQKDGSFLLSHLRAGSYRMVAFKDEDKNLKPGPEEAMAFLSTPVQAWQPLPAADSVADSARPTPPQQPQLQLRLYEPLTLKQRITGSSMPRPGMAVVAAAAAMQAPTLLCPTDSTVWQLNPAADTLRVWCLHQAADSLTLYLTDSSGLHDTLRLKYTAPKTFQAQNDKASGPKRKSAVGQEPFLRFNCTGKLEYFDTLRLAFATPVALRQAATVPVGTLMSLQDSSLLPICMVLNAIGLQAIVTDSTGAPLALTQGQRYVCTLRDSALVDLYGRVNDSATLTFEVTEAEKYANIEVLVSTEGQPASQAPTPYIVQLLDSKNEVVQEHIVVPPATVQFPHVQPATYRLRAIEDSNSNGRWDPGDWLQQRQPEPIHMYSKPLELRANWDFHEQWNLGTSAE